MSVERALAIIAIAATGCSVLAASANALTPPERGSVRISARTPDPAGGPDWAVRSWVPRPAPGDSRDRYLRCAQVGQLVDGRLVRRFPGRPDRVLGREDRTWCGSVLPADPDPMPISIERLVADPRAPQAGPARTVVAGIVTAKTTSASLWVRGAASPLRIDPASKAFLAVLPGSVRRADLAVETTQAGHTYRFDYGQGGGVQGRLVPGSVHRAVTVADPTGGLPLGLLEFTQRSDSRRGPLDERCLEPGRVLGSEVGAYEPRFGSFLDGPTLAQQAAFEDTWQPNAPEPAAIGACTNAFDPPYGGFDAVSAKRLGSGLVVVHGFLPRGSPGLRVRIRRVRTAPPGIGANGEFLVPVLSRGRLAERVELIARKPGGRRRRETVDLGPHHVSTAWAGWTVVDGGRTLRVHWTGGFEPYSGVRVKEGRRRVSVRVFQQFPPTFSDEGGRHASPAIGIEKCVRIHLRRPLGGRAVVDASTGRPRRPVRAFRPGRPPPCRRAHRPSPTRIINRTDG